MVSSPACFAAFTTLLAHEYSDPALRPTHRLTVDTYAVQHPGRSDVPQAVQSVGLHLARLGLQIERMMPPKQTNDVMLGLGRHKASLVHLAPPRSFELTVADVIPWAGTERHAVQVRAWAETTWIDWAEHHAYIRAWTRLHLQMWDRPVRNRRHVKFYEVIEG